MKQKQIIPKDTPIEKEQLKRLWELGHAITDIYLFPDLTLEVIKLGQVAEERIDADPLLAAIVTANNQAAKKWSEAKRKAAKEEQQKGNTNKKTRASLDGCAGQCSQLTKDHEQSLF